MAERVVIASRFELHAEVASGGMGRVHRALDRQTGQIVALKLVRRDVDVDADRFAREAEILAGLSHPGIVAYVDHGRAADGSLYLAMEWVEGRTLAHRLEQRGLDARESVAMARQAALALAEAHRAGVIHRDLKPSNLLLEGGDPARPKIIDFGVARRFVEPVSITRTGTAMGTPAYMAPEQARGERHLDSRADLFALGCILYECLTGGPAFTGESPTAVMAKITLLDPAPVSGACPEAPRELEVLVTRLLAKSRARRPPDAAAVAEALAALGALPAGPRRPLGTAALTTTVPTVTRDGYAAFTVLASLEPGVRAPTEAPAEELVERLRGLVEAHGAAVDALRDGTILVVVAGTDEHEAAQRAARVALLVRAEVQGEVVLASGGERAGTDPVGAALDRGARVLSTGALHAVFAGLADDAPARGVRLDSRTAQLIGPGFVTERRDGGTWLVG